MARDVLLTFALTAVSGLWWAIPAEAQVTEGSGTEVRTREAPWTHDQEDAKATVERFLVVAGNYDLEAMDEMILDEASLGIARFADGEWQTSSLTFEEYFENARDRELAPYYEPVSVWDVRIDEGLLAFVRADAILTRFGIPRSRNVDYFTLLKENGSWRFINISFTSRPLPDEERTLDLQTFARGYAQAWSGVRPEFVALFFEEEGSLQVNDGEPAVGRSAIEEVARGFMTDLPDMVVRADSLVDGPRGTEFHWTLTATYSGPGGNGNPVRVSGLEQWRMGESGRITHSRGHFPTEEYERQIGSR